MKKRILSFFLSVAMIVTMLPTVTLPAMAAASSWTLNGNTYEELTSTSPITLGSSGTTSYYYVSSSREITATTAGQSAIKIQGTVHLYIEENVTLTVKGADGSGQTGGGAGIWVPSSTTLYIEGKGTLQATGGKAGNGADGSNGNNATGTIYSELNPNATSFVYAGAGGKGGKGGGGSGAGIGTPGANGGNGGGSGGSSTQFFVNANGAISFGGNGYAGEGGLLAAAPGTVYIVDSIKAHVSAGDAGTGGAGGSVGNPKIMKQSNGYMLATGGAGGGGGGGGTAGAAFGRGGSGGGGGGGGGGGICATYSNDWLPNAGGGKGGSGATNGADGEKVNITEDRYTYFESTANTHSTANDRTGGSGGSYSANQAGGVFTRSSTATAGSLAATATNSTVKITFDENGGTIEDSSYINVVYHTTTVASTSIPKVTRTGYELLGWYTDAAKTTKVLNADGTQANANVTGWIANGTWVKIPDGTLYAGWEPIEYDITLDSNQPTTASGTLVSGAATHTVQYLNAVTPIVSRPTLTGWTFNGYYTEQTNNGSQVFDAGGNVVANVPDYTDASGNWVRMDTATLYAQWKPNEYSISFDLNAASSTLQSPSMTDNTSVQVTFDGTLNNLTGYVPTMAGYIFGGWYTESNCTNMLFAADGKVQPNCSTYTKNGNWVNAGDATVYAKWIPIDYTVTLNSDGGNPVYRDYPVAYESENWTQNMAMPTRTGYVFKGFYTEQNGGGTQYINENMSPAVGKEKWDIIGPTTLYAHWASWNYKVELYTIVDGAQKFVFEILDVPYGGTLNLPGVKVIEDANANWVKDNHTFLGWSIYPTGNWAMYVEGDNPAVEIFGTTEGSTVKLYAVWRENDKFSVTYNANGGIAENLPLPNFVYTGTKITVTDVIPTLAGYDFNGWISSIDGNVLQAGSTVAVDNADITFTAKWEKIPTYTLTYDANGGMGVPQPEEVRQNTSAAVNFSTTPYRVGYTFLGYAESENASAATYTANETTTITMDSDKTLYAVWEKNVYTITKAEAGGYTIDVENDVTTVEHGGGYTFTVTVGDNYDGSAMTVAINGAVQALADVNGKVYTYNVSNVTEDQHITVSGLTSAAYSVTLHLNGGQLDTYANVSSYSYGTGKALPTSTAVRRTGYTFEGWYNNASFTGNAVTEISATDSGDKVFWAKWTPKQYTIAFNGNGATDGSTEAISNVQYDTSVTLTANGFTNTNKFFMGWSDVQNATFPRYSDKETVKNLAEDGTVTLYAVWSDTAQYYVTYNANGGSGAPSDSSAYEVGTTVNTVDGTPTRPGYTFRGWAISSNGTATDVVTSATMVTGGLTFYAVWVKNTTYTVNYHPNGGEGSIPVDVTAYETGDTVTVSFLPLPKKVGYTFLGWATAEGTTTADYTETGTKEFAIGTANVTLYAVWTPITYTIEYHGEGAPASQTMTYDVTAALNAAGAKQGHQFKGWAISERDAANGIARYEDQQSVVNLAATQDAVINLYAVWTPAVTAITFNFEGGSGGTGSASVNYGNPLPSGLSAPTRYGYTFTGYYAAQNGQGQQYYSANMVSQISAWDSVAEGFTLYACWEGVDYTVLYVNGDTQLATMTKAKYGVPFKLATAETLGLTAPLGKRFAGWSIWSGSESVAYTDGQEIKTGLTNVDGDTVYLYAVWTDVETYKVTYNANGGQGIPSDTTAYYYGDQVTVDTTNVPILIGYTFLGWSQNPFAVTPDGTTFTITTDVTLYAVWQANQYTVKYYSEGTDLNSPTTLTYGVSGELRDGTGLSREGYTFAGWSLSPGSAVSYLGGQQVIDLSVTAGAEIKLYAVWTANKVLVTFDANGGSVAPESLNYTYGESYGLLPTPTREGYTFLGWYTEADAGAPVTGTTEVTSAVPHTLYAHWQIKTYTVTASAGSGYTVELSSGAVNYGGGYTITVTIDEKYDTSSFTVEVNNVVQTAASVTGNEFTYTVENVSSDQYVKVNGLAIRTFSIGYVLNGGAMTTTDFATGYAAGETTTLPTDAEISKTGFTFDGWYDNPEFSGTAVTEIASTDRGNKTFYAKWNAIEYPVTYNPNGGTGTAPSAATGQVGSVISLPENPFENPGYVFVGWNTNANETHGEIGNYPIVSADVVDDKITFYAIWRKSDSVTYTVEHYQQNTTLDGYVKVGNDTETHFGTTSAYVEATPKTYTGFTYNSAASTVGGTILKDGSLVLTLYYDRNVYDVELVTNGGIINDGNVDIYTYGNGATLPTNVTREGFTFDGWYANSDLTGTPATNIGTDAIGDKTFYAKWSGSNATEYTVEHYRQKLDGGYELVINDTQILTGITGDYTQAVAKTYDGFTALPIEKQTIAADGSTVVNVYYERNEYVLTFNANGGVGGTTARVLFGAEIEAPVVTRDGWSFARWEPTVDETMPAADTTYTAQWTQATYTVTLPDEQVGYTLTQSGNGTYNYGDTVTLTLEAKDGYDLSNINVYANSSKLIFDSNGKCSFEVTENTVITVDGVSGALTVTYHPNGGKGVPYDHNSYAAGDTVKVIFNDILVYGGYTFMGWDTDPNATTPTYIEGVKESFEILENTTLYAIWNIDVKIMMGDQTEYKATYDGVGHTMEIVQVGEGTLEYLSYQWYKDGVLIEGATESTYTVKNVADSGEYTCYVEYTKNTYDHTTTTAVFEVEISKAEITVSATAAQVMYGEPAPAFTYTATGFVQSEQWSNVVRGRVTFSTNYKLGDPVGEYIVTPFVSGLTADNYSFKTANGTLTVTKRPFTLSPTELTVNSDIIWHSGAETFKKLMLNNLTVGQYSGKGGLATRLSHTIENLNLSFSYTNDGTYPDRVTVTVTCGNGNYELHTTEITVNVTDVLYVVEYGTFGRTSATITLYRVNSDGSRVAVHLEDTDMIFMIYAYDASLDGQTYADYKNLTPVKTVTMTEMWQAGKYMATYSRLPSGSYRAFAIAKGYTIVVTNG